MVSRKWRSTVKSGFSEVSGFWKIMAMLRPRIASRARPSMPRMSVPAIQDAAAGDPPGRLQELEEGQPEGGLAAARLAHEPQRFPVRQGEDTPSTARTVPMEIG